ncbi:MAG: amino acid permease [Lachnospiraceae bacterium]|nr:amino acid permease [Lachnospiraceae bacterium]
MVNVNNNNSGGTDNRGLSKYLSPVSVWALSFGCAVGWGSFVMPGTTFLPAAGPLGTVLGLVTGAVVMFIIGLNYHYLMNRFPDSGGTLTYAIKTFGYDHGFISAWFLLLVYIAIIWANATALSLIGRYLPGDVFQFGFHYTVLGYDVYQGEVMLSMVCILVFGFICIKGKKLAVLLQVIAAFMLIAGIVICSIAVFRLYRSMGIRTVPSFSQNGRLPIRQIFTIVALSPWAFAGFESVSNSAEGFNFSMKKTKWVLLVSLVTGAVSYILLAGIAVSIIPDRYDGWTDYIGGIGNLNGLEGLPTFYSVSRALGNTGVFILGLAAAAAIITGLVGNYIAGSRLLYAMSREGILPEWFGKLNEDGSPKNALVLLMGVSLLIPFIGRTAIGWIVDVNTVGATIAYGYTSLAAFVNAKKEKNTAVMATGITGFLMSVIFFFYSMSWSATAMSTESYLILAFWSILGFVFFKFVFSRDTQGRYGESTIVLIGVLFLIFFTSLMWVKHATDDMTEGVVINISEYYEKRNPSTDPAVLQDTERYIQEQLDQVDRLLSRNSLIQMGLIIVSLGIMMSIYATISAREEKAEIERFRAEESNKAKSVFLSNMSHDIRTPMNAIIGYINLAERDDNDLSEVLTYLSKIKTSSQHLLALINDVLEMSRIESGKMDLEPIPVDLKKTLYEVHDMFSVQMEQKNIDFTVDSSTVRHSNVYCDKNRFNRVLLNLTSNAYKFTPEGGSVSIKLKELDDGNEDFGSYELRVKDSGIGMSEEFADKVFEAFEREKSDAVNAIQGTGLGMAITKNLVELMGGDISVNTAPGEGAEFVIRIKFELRKGEAVSSEEKREDRREHGLSVDFSRMRLLLAEDMPINREIAIMILTNMGFTIETAENGKQAVDMVKASEPGYYDLVLMDIQMPIMDGYEAAREIRNLDNKALSGLPIIAMTANAFSEDVKKAHEAGMDAHIAKPIDIKQMTETLKEVLG